MTKHVSALDGLRALSICFVLYMHVSNAHSLPKAFSATSLGPDGVLIFFVISGYLITSNLLREKIGTGTINIGSFLLQRAFRLLPASFLLISVAALLNCLGIVPLTSQDILHAATYTVDYYPTSTPTLGHLWSLSVEEQFYLLWPFVVVFTALKGAKTACICVLLICPVVRLMDWHLVGPELVVTSRRFHDVADSLSMGCLLSMIQTKLPAWTQSSTAVILALLVILASGLAASRNSSLIVIQVTIVSVCATVIIHSLNSKRLWISRLFAWEPFAWLGTVSYSLYLWQQLFTVATPLGRLKIFSFPYNLLDALACATASYYFVERPIRDWGKRFRPSRTRVSCGGEVAA